MYMQLSNSNWFPDLKDKGGGGGGGARWQSGNTLVSHLRDQGLVPGPASSGKVGSCLPLVNSLQYLEP